MYCGIISFSVFVWAMVAMPALTEAAQSDDATLWYAAHVGQSECVPLHDIDPDDVSNPVAFGDFARTPDAFVAELKAKMGTNARNITLEMRSPDLAVVRVDAVPRGFTTVLIQGLDLCHNLMQQIRSRK